MRLFVRLFSFSLCVIKVSRSSDGKLLRKLRHSLTFSNRKAGDFSGLGHPVRTAWIFSEPRPLTWHSKTIVSPRAASEAALRHIVLFFLQASPSLHRRFAHRTVHSSCDQMIPFIHSLPFIHPCICVCLCAHVCRCGRFQSLGFRQIMCWLLL